MSTLEMFQCLVHWLSDLMTSTPETVMRPFEITGRTNTRGCAGLGIGLNIAGESHKLECANVNSRLGCSIAVFRASYCSSAANDDPKNIPLDSDNEGEGGTSSKDWNNSNGAYESLSTDLGSRHDNHIGRSLEQGSDHGKTDVSCLYRHNESDSSLTEDFALREQLHSSTERPHSQFIADPVVLCAVNVAGDRIHINDGVSSETGQLHAPASTQRGFTPEGKQTIKPLLYDELQPGSIRLLTFNPTSTSGEINCKLTQQELHPGLKYTAVSYAWGARPNSHLIFLNGHRVYVRKNLWRFLRAACTLESHDLGALWIDALCINQSDHDERQSQVNLMPQIYSSARQVVAWLGPSYGGSDEAMDHLARVRSGKQAKRNFGLRTTTVGVSVGRLCWRPYWSRLWILQELVTAKQIWLMCGNKICPWRSFRDMVLQIHSTQDISNRRSIARMEDSLELGIIQDSPAISIVPQIDQHPISRHLYGLMRATRHLRCAEKHDKVYALLGITTSGHRGITPDYDLPLPILLNIVLEASYEDYQPPEHLGEVLYRCEELTAIVGVDVNAMFQLVDGYGTFVIPSEGTMEEYPINYGHPAMSLWWAAFYGHGDIERLFLEEGSSANVGHWLDQSIRGDNEEVMTFISQRKAAADTASDFRRYDFALLSACAGGHSKMAEWLILAGADVNAGGGTHDTPLVAALRAGHQDPAEMLVHNGADVHARGRGMTALGAAVVLELESTVRLLIEHGADVNTPFENAGYKVAPILQASRCQSADILQVLLDVGANIFTRRNGFTALSIAAWLGREAMAEMLVKRAAAFYANIEDCSRTLLGGDPDDGAEAKFPIDPETNRKLLAKYHGGALEVALAKGRDNIVDMIVKVGVQTNSLPGMTGYALESAAADGDEGLVRTLLQWAIDSNFQIHDHYSGALHRVMESLSRLKEKERYVESAATTSHERVAVVLIEAGADGHSRVDGQASVLALAVKLRSPAVAEALIAKDVVCDDIGGEDQQWLEGLRLRIFEAAEAGHSFDIVR